MSHIIMHPWSDEDEKRPKCDCCGKIIFDDSFYFIDKEVICDDCGDKREYRMSVDEWIEKYGG